MFLQLSLPCPQVMCVCMCVCICVCVRVNVYMYTCSACLFSTVYWNKYILSSALNMTPAKPLSGGGASRDLRPLCEALWT